jgi:hypothetical protein
MNDAGERVHIAPEHSIHVGEIVVGAHSGFTQVGLPYAVSGCVFRCKGAHEKMQPPEKHFCPT